MYSLDVLNDKLKKTNNIYGSIMKNISLVGFDINDKGMDAIKIKINKDVCIKDVLANSVIFLSKSAFIEAHNFLN